MAFLRGLLIRAETSLQKKHLQKATVGCPTSRHDHQRRSSRRANVPLHHMMHFTNLVLALTVHIDVPVVDFLAWLSFYRSCLHVIIPLSPMVCQSLLTTLSLCYFPTLLPLPSASATSCSNLSSNISLLFTFLITGDADSANVHKHVFKTRRQVLKHALAFQTPLFVGETAPAYFAWSGNSRSVPRNRTILRSAYQSQS